MAVHNHSPEVISAVPIFADMKSKELNAGFKVCTSNLLLTSVVTCSSRLPGNPIESLYKIVLV
jgi:hypothetical protein